LPWPVFVSWDDLGKCASKDRGADRKGSRGLGEAANDLRSDKFQAYVLHEAFTELVQGASARLLMLTQERYSLQFHDDEIQVVDHDNADETRIGGRMVGIITHIPELRDEFAQQVIVTKHQGFSTVEVRGLAEVA
jgi:hypothetical protein